MDLGTEGVPVELEDLAALFSRRTALAYRLVSSTGRMVAIKLATTMAGRKSNSMIKFMEKVHAKEETPMRVNSIVKSMAHHRARHRSDQIEDGKESNTQRLVRRSAYYSALLANTLIALQRTYAQALTIEAICVLTAEQKIPDFQPEQFVSYQRLAKKAVYRLMENAHHPLTGAWVYGAVGVAAQPSVNGILAHVRKLVIPTGVARKEAAQELRQLSEKPFSADDCQALSSKTQKVFRNLFPKVTEESEPVSRLTAMKLVHKLMDNLKSAKGNKGATILAWKQYSGYFHSQMFLEFLDESLHISQAKSEDLC